MYPCMDTHNMRQEEGLGRKDGGRITVQLRDLLDRLLRSESLLRLKRSSRWSCLSSFPSYQPQRLRSHTPSSKHYLRFPPNTEIQKLQGDFYVKSAQEVHVTCRSLFCGSFIICRESYALDAKFG